MNNLHFEGSVPADAKAQPLKDLARSRSHLLKNFSEKARDPDANA